MRSGDAGYRDLQLGVEVVDPAAEQHVLAPQLLADHSQLSSVSGVRSLPSTTLTNSVPKWFDKKLGREFLRTSNKVLAREGAVRIRVVSRWS
jgi:hypothetical protein